MVKSFTGRKRVRKNFGRIPSVAPMPNLIEVQKSSYSQFLQLGVPAAKRTETGLQEVLKSIFPIKDFPDAVNWNTLNMNWTNPNMTLTNVFSAV